MTTPEEPPVDRPAVEDDGPVAEAAARPRWRRLLVLVIEIVVLVALGVTLYQRRESLAALLDLSAADVVMLFAVTFAATPLRAVELRTVTRTLDAELALAPAFALNQAATTLNYLPMQAGSLLRGRVLKQHRALSYTRYVSLMTAMVALNIVSAAVVGLAAMGMAQDLPAHVAQVAGLAFGAVLAGGVAFFAFPWQRVRLGDSRVAQRVADLLSGWTQIRADKRALLVLVGTTAATPILLGVRYWICFGAISRPIGLAEAVLFAAAVLALAPVNITPAGLGIRELLGSSIGAAAGLDFTEVLAAVAIDRGVSVVHALLVGGGSLAWLRRRGMV